MIMVYRFAFVKIGVIGCVFDKNGINRRHVRASGLLSIGFNLTSGQLGLLAHELGLVSHEFGLPENEYERCNAGCLKNKRPQLITTQWLACAHEINGFLPRFED